MALWPGRRREGAGQEVKAKGSRAATTVARRPLNSLVYRHWTMIESSRVPGWLWVLRSQVQQARDSGDEFARLDGLGNMHLEAGEQRALTIVVARIGRKRDGGQVAHPAVVQ